MENSQYTQTDNCRNEERIPSESGSTVVINVDEYEIIGTIENKSNGGIGLLIPESFEKHFENNQIITLNYSMPHGLVSQKAKICWTQKELRSESDELLKNKSAPSNDLKVGTSFLENRNNFQTNYQKLWSGFSQAKTLEEAAAYWLTLQCTLISGVTRGVVILKQGDSDTFAPVSLWPKGQSANLGLTEVAELCMQERRGVVRDEGQVNPDLNHAVTYVAFPLMIVDQISGVVAIELLSRDDYLMAAVMQQLQWGGAWMELFVHRQLARKYSPENQPFISVLELIASTLKHEKFHASATAVITEIATLLNCERVSLGLIKGDHIKVLALSHSSDFSKKSAMVKLIALAMDEAVDQNVSLIYPAKEDRTVQVLRFHEKLAIEQNIDNICTIPLSLEGKGFGALTLERSNGVSFDQRTLDLCETMASMIGPILDAKQKADRSFLSKGWYSLKEYKSKLFGQSHELLKLITTGFIALVLFSIFAEGDYRISADTTLEGSTQRVIVTPFDGFIYEANIRAGDEVKKDMLLVKLDDKELLLEKAKWQSQIRQYMTEYRNALGQDERSKISVLKSQLGQAESQLDLVNAKLSRANITAPFDGVVVSGDLSQSLGSPSQRGDVLFEIAPLDSYRIILEVDERDVGHIQINQKGELVLNGHSDKIMSFNVTRVMPISNPREGRNYFRVEASFDKSYEFLRPGMNGVGKISIDQRRLVSIWSKEMLDWLRLTFWTWWPEGL